jgi:hypothetical protein
MRSSSDHPACTNRAKVYSQSMPPRAAAGVLLALLAALPAGLGAHEVPAEVTIHAFVRPEGDRLRLIVRAPMAAMRDINFPARGPGCLDIGRADPFLRSAASLWIAGAVRLLENDAVLPAPRITAIRVSLPSDRSFVAYESALAHTNGAPLPSDTEIVWSQALLDVVLDYSIRSDRSQFTIDPEFSRLGVRVTTVLRFVPPGGAVRAFEFVGDPGLVRLDPRWHQSALRFVRAGFFHILDGVDHLLFLLCLVIPFRNLRPLVLVVTAFTIAHSITLVGSAFGLAPDSLWFPPLVEMLIAASIVYLALEQIVKASRGNLRPAAGPSATSIRTMAMVAFVFGLVHGFGFSFALAESMQFAGAHLLTSLLSFNVGVEIGQLLVLALLVPLLSAGYRLVVAERAVTIVLLALIAHTGWHWMLERAERLAQFQFQWPVLDASFAAAALRWMMVAVIAGALAWLVRNLQADKKCPPADIDSPFESASRADSSRFRP